jgi:hypothetical protein
MFPDVSSWSSTGTEVDIERGSGRSRGLHLRAFVDLVRSKASLSGPGSSLECPKSGVIKDEGGRTSDCIWQNSPSGDGGKIYKKGRRVAVDNDMGSIFRHKETVLLYVKCGFLFNRQSLLKLHALQSEDYRSL